MDGATFSLLTRTRVITLHIPRSVPGCDVATAANSIEGVEQAALALRRAAAAKAAAARAAGAAESSEEEDLTEDDPMTSDDAHTLHVQTLPVASSIGGKIWDASLLMGAWLTAAADHFPPPASPDGRRPRALELGSGLGIAGLAAAKVFPWLHVTLSDYDPAVVANLHENIRLSFPTPAHTAQGCPQQLVDVATVDIRDFAASTGGAVPPQYAALGQFDLIFASDVVYESSHSQLAYVCRALLAPPPLNSEGWSPHAVFLLPDSRPRLREFVDALDIAGLSCRIENLLPSSAMVRRLRQTHDDWGAGGATFSLYFVSRRPIA